MTVPVRTMIEQPLKDAIREKATETNSTISEVCRQAIENQLMPASKIKPITTEHPAYCRVQVRLEPKTVEKIQKIANKKAWKFSQTVRIILNNELNPKNDIAG